MRKCQTKMVSASIGGWRRLSVSLPPSLSLSFFFAHDDGHVVRAASMRVREHGAEWNIADSQAIGSIRDQVGVGQCAGSCLEMLSFLLSVCLSVSSPFIRTGQDVWMYTTFTMMMLLSGSSWESTASSLLVIWFWVIFAFHSLIGLDLLIRRRLSFAHLPLWLNNTPKSKSNWRECNYKQKERTWIELSLMWEKKKKKTKRWVSSSLILPLPSSHSQ